MQRGAHRRLHHEIKWLSEFLCRYLPLLAVTAFADDVLASARDHSTPSLLRQLLLTRQRVQSQAKCFVPRKVGLFAWLPVQKKPFSD